MKKFTSLVFENGEAKIDLFDKPKSMFCAEVNWAYLFEFLKKREINYRMDGTTFVLSEDNKELFLSLIDRKLNLLDEFCFFDDLHQVNWECDRFSDYWKESGVKELLSAVGEFVSSVGGKDIQEDLFDIPDLDEDTEGDAEVYFLLLQWLQFSETQDEYFIDDSPYKWRFVLNTDRFFEEYGTQILEYFGCDREKIELFWAKNNPNQYELALNA